jgi:hypothetical protein
MDSSKPSITALTARYIIFILFENDTAILASRAVADEIKDGTIHKCSPLVNVRNEKSHA